MRRRRSEKRSNASGPMVSQARIVLLGRIRIDKTKKGHIHANQTMKRGARGRLDASQYANAVQKLNQTANGTYGKRFMPGTYSPPPPPSIEGLAARDLGIAHMATPAMLFEIALVMLLGRPERLGGLDLGDDGCLPLARCRHPALDLGGDAGLLR